MRIFRNVLIHSVIAVIFFMFSADFTDAKTFHVEISPKIINQGDAYVIKVKGGKNPFVPSATVAENEIRFSSCGDRCFIGIGAMSINTKAGDYPVTVRAGKVTRHLRLKVKKGAFPTTSLTLPEEKVTVSPEDLKIIEAENDLLKSLFISVSERLWEGAFLTPLDNAISTPFGAKRIMNETWTSIHRGVDIKGSDGEEVKASNNGKVVLAKGLFFGGNTIVLDHGQGIHTIYMHLSQMNVRSGDSVAKGDVIGLVGSSGRSTGPHLHFGVKISDVSVNPLSMLKLKL